MRWRIWELEFGAWNLMDYGSRRDPLNSMLQIENPAPVAQLFLHFMACSSKLGFGICHLSFGICSMDYGCAVIH